MQYTIPHYFDRFRCVAAECEDTCCAGWAIMIDEDTLEKYKQLEGTFGERLRQSVDWENGCFCQHDNRCAFLNRDNLCDLHLQAGERMLCNTCRDYPRHMEEFEGLREGSLTLSCIEAAKIILGCKEPVQFIHFEDDAEDEEYEDFDYLLFTKLMDAREKIIAMLQNREVDIMTRVGLVLETCEHLQEAIDTQELYRIDEVLKKLDGMEPVFSFQQELRKYHIGENEYCAAMRKVFRTFYKLEVLKEEWPEYVKKAEFSLYGEGQRAYESVRSAFHKEVGVNGEHYEEWAIWQEQLIIYFVFTYFCGAVYDSNALGKLQVATVVLLLIQELCIARWMEKGKEFTFDDFVDISHRVSREIEHSDVNLNRLEKMCEKTPVLQVEQLLRMVLCSIIV